MKTAIERYTYSSLVDESINRKQHKNCDYTASITGTKRFTQTESFEEAVDFAKSGWDLGLKEYKIDDGLLVGGVTELAPSLAGCIPHVQNHIMGFPEEMYSLYDNREYNLPTLDIVVNIAYSAGLNSKYALSFGKSIVNYINTMASSYNIRLTGIIGQNLSHSEQKVFYLITLKDFDSALVINNIAFAFHPSFFRRLWFSIFEGKEYWQSGYGSPVDNVAKAYRESVGGDKADKTVIFKGLNDLHSYEFTPDNINSFLEK